MSAIAGVNRHKALTPSSGNGSTGAWEIDRMGGKEPSGFSRWTVGAQIRLPITTVQLIEVNLVEPVDFVLCHENAFRLDLSLGSRLQALLSFRDRWAPHRFEPAGRLFLLPPGECLRVKSGVGQTTAMVCYLSTDVLKEWFSTDFEWTHSRLEASLDIRNVAIINLLLQLGEEARNPGFASDVFSEGIAMQIAVNLHRHLIAVEGSSLHSPLSAWRLRLIEERIQDDLEPPSLSELASLCRLSVRQLARGFRASRGMSIGAYVAEIRLERAKRLLANGSTVKNVAYTLGFKSSSSFCTAFRKATGFTARQFGQQARSLNLHP